MYRLSFHDMCHVFTDEHPFLGTLNPKNWETQLNQQWTKWIKTKTGRMEKTGLSQADLTMEEKIQLADLFIRFQGTRTRNWIKQQIEDRHFFFFFFEADFIQLVVLNLSHLNYIKLCLFLTSNKRWSFKLQLSSVGLYAEL